MTVDEDERVEAAGEGAAVAGDGGLCAGRQERQSARSPQVT